jgi:GNAT superfamily N-acetyltransferase
MVRQLVQTGAEASRSELREFLGQHAAALLPASYGAPEERVLDHAVESVLAADALVAGRRDGRLCGLATMSRAPVDEEIYGLGMGQMRTFLAGGSYREACEAYGAMLEATWQSARERGIEHLSSTVSVDDVAARHSLQAAGFLLMDTRVEYAWRPSLVDSERKSYGFLIRAASEPDEAAEPVRLLTMGASVRLFEPADLSSLQAIAAEAFTERTRSRYTVDPALPTEDTGRLYSRWVENAASGRFGDLIVVGEADGVPIGFQILRIERELSEAIGVSIGAMGIGAVVPDARGTGVFPALLAEILAWCRGQGIQFARGGVLVNNARMHRPCIATGGTVVASHHSFHGHRA